MGTNLVNKQPKQTDLNLNKSTIKGKTGTMQKPPIEVGSKIQTKRKIETIISEKTKVKPNVGPSSVIREMRASILKQKQSGFKVPESKLQLIEKGNQNIQDTLVNRTKREEVKPKVKPTVYPGEHTNDINTDESLLMDKELPEKLSIESPSEISSIKSLDEFLETIDNVTADPTQQQTSFEYVIEELATNTKFTDQLIQNFENGDSEAKSKIAKVIDFVDLLDKEETLIQTTTIKITEGEKRLETINIEQPSTEIIDRVTELTQKVYTTFKGPQYDGTKFDVMVIKDADRLQGSAPEDLSKYFGTDVVQEEPKPTDPIPKEGLEKSLTVDKPTNSNPEEDLGELFELGGLKIDDEITSFNLMDFMFEDFVSEEQTIKFQHEKKSTTVKIQPKTETTNITSKHFTTKTKKSVISNFNPANVLNTSQQNVDLGLENPLLKYIQPQIEEPLIQQIVEPTLEDPLLKYLKPELTKSPSKQSTPTNESREVKFNVPDFTGNEFDSKVKIETEIKDPIFTELIKEGGSLNSIEPAISEILDSIYDMVIEKSSLEQDKRKLDEILTIKIGELKKRSSLAESAPVYFGSSTRLRKTKSMTDLGELKNTGGDLANSQKDKLLLSESNPTSNVIDPRKYTRWNKDGTTTIPPSMIRFAQKGDNQQPGQNPPIQIKELAPMKTKELVLIKTEENPNFIQPLKEIIYYAPEKKPIQKAPEEKLIKVPSEILNDNSQTNPNKIDVPLLKEPTNIKPPAHLFKNTEKLAQRRNEAGKENDEIDISEILKQLKQDQWITTEDPDYFVVSKLEDPSAPKDKELVGEYDLKSGCSIELVDFDSMDEGINFNSQDEDVALEIEKLTRRQRFLRNIAYMMTELINATENSLPEIAQGSFRLYKDFRIKFTSQTFRDWFLREYVKRYRVYFVRRANVKVFMLNGIATSTIRVSDFTTESETVFEIQTVSQTFEADFYRNMDPEADELLANQPKGSHVLMFSKYDFINKFFEDLRKMYVSDDKKQENKKKFEGLGIFLRLRRRLRMLI
jgi:hypothetical protein